MIEAVHIPEEKYNGDTIVVSQPMSQRQRPVSQTSKGVQQLPSPSTTPQARNTPDPQGTPSLDRRNRSPSPDLVERQILQVLSALRYTPHTTPGGWNFDKNTDDLGSTRESYISNRQQNNAPQHRDPDLSQENIVSSRRCCQAHFIEAAPVSSKYFAFAATIAQANEATLVASPSRIKPDPTRIHWNDLPPLPCHWKELKCHAHGKQFEAASEAEFSKCWKKGTFAKPDIMAKHIDAVPLMWVSSYKFNKNGYLYKYKARLVVRGDLQEQ
jgi:hypothetical protein